MEGEYVETMTVERGFETTFHTQEDQDAEQQHELSIEYIESLKNKVQEQLSTWNQVLVLMKFYNCKNLIFVCTKN